MILPNNALPILLDILKDEKLSVFAGSGISVDSGLPTWDGFAKFYISMCETLNNSIKDASFKFTDIINDAKDPNNKDLIATITALKEKVKYYQTKTGANIDFFSSQLNKKFLGVEPNDYHNLIVSTNYKHIITTNYDNLLEDAAQNLKYDDLLFHSYGYEEYRNVSAAIYQGISTILHAHGKIVDLTLEKMVLTKTDYLNIMKHNPGFRILINTIFVTNSVLFVGYGGSDPHFEDIINDLNVSLNWSQDSTNLPKCYLMLKTDKATPIRDFISNSNRIEIIPFDDYSDMKSFLEDLHSKCPRPH